MARAKVVAFAISAVYAAVSGSLLSLANGYITTDTAGFMHSVEMVTMAVLGGTTTFYGGIVGSLILTALPQVLTIVSEYEHIVLGAVMVATMVAMRRGLVPALGDLTHRLRSCGRSK